MTDAAEVALLRKRLAQRYPLVQRSIEVETRLWRVTAVQDQDALLDTVESEEDLHNFPYGMLLWASAIGLARHIGENPPLVRGMRVLEIGAGAGLPGLVAASVGAELFQTDYQADTLALARINAWDNTISTIQQAVGDWTRWKIKGPFDLVIGSDVLYEKDLHADLERVLEKQAKLGARVLLSDPLRPQALEFITRLEKQGWAVEKTTRQVNWEGELKEIGLFHLELP